MEKFNVSTSQEASNDWEQLKSNFPTFEVKRNHSFKGKEEEYKWIKVSDFGLFESIVENQEGKEFFITTKRPKEQKLAATIGNYTLNHIEKYAS